MLKINSWQKFMALPSYYAQHKEQKQIKRVKYKIKVNKNKSNVYIIIQSNYTRLIFQKPNPHAHQKLSATKRMKTLKRQPFITSSKRLSYQTHVNSIVYADLDLHLQGSFNFQEIKRLRQNILHSYYPTQFLIGSYHLFSLQRANNVGISIWEKQYRQMCF